MCKRYYHPIEQASLDELQALQLERMRWSLKHAYKNVSMYRQKCDEAQVNPNDLKTLTDLEKFPFTCKEDLRKNYPFNSFAVSMDKVVRIHASSGTTGKPTVVGYTKKDIETWAEVVARSIYAAGGGPGDRVHVAYGYGLFTGGLGAHYGVEKLGATVIPVSGGMTSRQVQVIEDFRPNIIMVTPSYLLNILEEYRRQGLDARKSSLKIGIFGAEPWTDEMRQTIENSFEMDATDIYGLSEVIGPGVGQECIESKNGPTLWEDHFYPEIINPETGKVLPDGQEGELVFTSLTKEAMPVIRYRTRDITTLFPGVARTMRYIKKITGRCDDMMIIRGINVFPSQIEERILMCHDLLPHYQIEIVRQGNLDALRVNVEAIPHCNETQKKAAIGKLRSEIKSFIGISVEVILKPTQSIPRSEGKAKRVIDLRSKA